MVLRREANGDYGPDASHKAPGLDWRKYRPPGSPLKHLKTFATIIANDVELTKQFAKSFGDHDETGVAYRLVPC